MRGGNRHSLLMTIDVLVVVCCDGDGDMAVAHKCI